MRMQEVTRKIGQAFRKVHAGDDKLAWHKLVPSMSPTLSVTSSAFLSNGTLPPDATVSGRGVAPEITVSGVPDTARSLALVCEDPDAPMPEPFVHWIVTGLPGADITIDPRVAMQAREGKNTKLKTGFTPAAPPKGHGPHHYHFQVFALDAELPVDQGAGRREVIDAMKNHVLAWGELVGTFEMA